MADAQRSKSEVPVTWPSLSNLQALALLCSTSESSTGRVFLLDCCVNADNVREDPRKHFPGGVVSMFGSKSDGDGEWVHVLTGIMTQVVALPFTPNQAR